MQGLKTITLRDGFVAKIPWIPGHSKGSIGILTAGGDLSCDDLLDNSKRPAINSTMDDPAAGEASLRRLRGYQIATVYPGHGRAFAMESYLAPACDDHEEE